MSTNPSLYYTLQQSIILYNCMSHYTTNYWLILHSTCIYWSFHSSWQTTDHYPILYYTMIFKNYITLLLFRVPSTSKTSSLSTYPSEQSCTLHCTTQHYIIHYYALLLTEISYCEHASIRKKMQIYLFFWCHSTP